MLASITPKACTPPTISLRGFELSDGNGIFYPATAEIVGDEIKVSCEQVRIPKSVRYAWSPVTDANLVNEDELPTSTFVF